MLGYDEKNMITVNDLLQQQASFSLMHFSEKSATILGMSFSEFFSEPTAHTPITLSDNDNFFAMSSPEDYERRCFLH